MRSKKTGYIAITSMLAAIASVLMFLEFPILPAAPFLKIDFSDLPALIGAFSLGPVCGVAVELVKNLIHLTRSDTGGVGELANFIVGVCLIVPAALFYKVKKTRLSAVLGLLTGTAVMALAAAAANVYILLPWYGFTPEGGVMNFLLTAIIPFNLIKGAMVSVVAIAFYKDISRLLSKMQKR